MDRKNLGKKIKLARIELDLNQTQLAKKINAKQKSISFEDRTELVQNKTIIAFIQLEVEKAQANLARYEKVKKIILLDKEFDLESGEITPSLKVKRHMIDKKYRTRIDALYEE